MLFICKSIRFSPPVTFLKEISFQLLEGNRVCLAEAHRIRTNKVSNQI